MVTNDPKAHSTHSKTSKRSFVNPRRVNRSRGSRIRDGFPGFLLGEGGMGDGAGAGAG